MSQKKPLKDDGDIKADYGKRRYDLVPITAIEGIAEIFTYGAQKYNDDNWLRSDYPDRYFAACMRHIAEVRKGKYVDPESKCFHVDHALVCLIMYRELLVKKNIHPDNKWYYGHKT
jgi:hypothetical protein